MKRDTKASIKLSVRYKIKKIIPSQESDRNIIFIGVTFMSDKKPHIVFKI